MTPEQIEARDYTLCTASYADETLPSGTRWEDFLVGTASRPEARERAAAYARAQWGEPQVLHIFPRNYVKKARGLLEAGRHD